MSNTDLEEAVEMLINKAANEHDSADALRFSQAALNIAHTKHALAELK